MPFKNFRRNRIQNGRPSATIYFHIADIWLTMLDSWTITRKQNARLQERMHLEKNWLNQIQNSCLSAIINFHIAVIW